MKLLTHPGSGEIYFTETREGKRIRKLTNENRIETLTGASADERNAARWIGFHPKTHQLYFTDGKYNRSMYASRIRRLEETTTTEP